MATTFKRICLRTETFYDPTTKEEITLERGREYITSREMDGQVIVFTRYWFLVPVDMFGGEIQFT